MDPEAPLPSSESSGSGVVASGGSSSIKLKDDPAFAKYFKVLVSHNHRFYRLVWWACSALARDIMLCACVKMLSMHLPKPAVVMKMVAEGVDPKVVFVSSMSSSTP